MLGLLTLNCFSTKSSDLVLFSCILYTANELKCPVKEAVFFTKLLRETATEALQLILPLHFLLPAPTYIARPCSDQFKMCL